MTQNTKPNKVPNRKKEPSLLQTPLSGPFGHFMDFLEENGYFSGAIQKSMSFF